LPHQGSRPRRDAHRRSAHRRVPDGGQPARPSVRLRPWHNPRSVRPLETYLVIACAVGVVWPALFGVRTRRGVMAAVLVGLVVLQWQVEGYRWPVFLLYVVAVGMAVGDVVAVERELPGARSEEHATEL